MLTPCVLVPSQALQYLRKLCNHPSLVLTSQHPEYKRITEELAAQSSSLRDIQHAPKLSALKQVTLLLRLALLSFCPVPSHDVFPFPAAAGLRSG